MAKMVLAMDIDGTIMHSSKTYSLDDICIESINGRRHGFMFASMLQALEGFGDCAVLVPITSRSIEQYMRIDWPSSIRPEKAYVANGAILLHIGLDGNYRAERTIDVNNAEYIELLEDALAKLSEKDDLRDPRIVDGCYAMAIFKQGKPEPGYAGVSVDSSRINSFVEGKKYYLFPKECTKDRAIRMLKASYPSSTIVCFGDSDNDRAMALSSDESFFPDEEQAETVSFEYDVITKLIELKIASCGESERG